MSGLTRHPGQQFSGRFLWDQGPPALSEFLSFFFLFTRSLSQSSVSLCLIARRPRQLQQAGLSCQGIKGALFQKDPSETLFTG